jgi:hypothetical protein
MGMHEKVGDSAAGRDEIAPLRYLDASKVESPLGDLGSVEVLGSDDCRLGHVAGVLIDPVERRLRFFVISGRHNRRYLLPTEGAARMNPGRKSLQVDVDAADLATYPEFSRATTQDFSDNDLLDALFAKRTA